MRACDASRRRLPLPFEETDFVAVRLQAWAGTVSAALLFILSRAPTAIVRRRPTVIACAECRRSIHTSSPGDDFSVDDAAASFD